MCGWVVTDSCRCVNDIYVVDTLYQREYDERLNLHGTTRERSGRPLQVLPMKNQRIHGLYRGTESSAVYFIGRNAGERMVSIPHDWPGPTTSGVTPV